MVLRWLCALVPLTPADAQVNVEVVPLGEHGDDQQVLQVDPLHQQPIAVGQDAVLHHHHGNTARHRGLHTRDGEMERLEIEIEIDRLEIEI